MNKAKKWTQKLVGNENSRSVVKNIAILASGSVISKFIGFISYPIITRIYSPEDIGVLSVFIAVIFILYPFCSLRYSVVIPLPKNDSTAMNLFMLGLLSTVVISGLLIISFALVGDTIFNFFNVPEITHYRWLLVFGIFGASIFDLLTNWSTRIKQFRIVAVANIWQTTISVITQVGMGLLGFIPLGLFVGEVARKWGGIVTQYRYLSSDFKENFKYVTKRRMIFLFKYYKDMPIFHLPSQLILVIASKIPIFYFAFEYGAETTGQLGLSLMVMAIPIGLISTTAANAYYAEIAKIGAKNRAEIMSLTISLSKRMFIISLLPTLVLLFTSPFLFQIIFGMEWREAGEFTSVLALYLLFEFTTTPLLKIFNVFDRQRKLLEISVVRITLIGVVFLFSHIFSMTAYNALVMYTIFMTIHFSYASYQVYRIIK